MKDIDKTPKKELVHQKQCKPADDCFSESQLKCAAAVAFLVGSPLQKSQPTAFESIQSSLLVVTQLLEYGVDPERIISLIST